VVSAARSRLRTDARHGGGAPMALRHSVLIVTHPGGVEFHLDHRVDPSRGHHRVVDEAGLVAWIADAGDAQPSFRVATGCPCRRGCAGRVAAGGEEATLANGPADVGAARLPATSSR
jgi:hypothetical protein